MHWFKFRKKEQYQIHIIAKKINIIDANQFKERWPNIWYFPKIIVIHFTKKNIIYVIKTNYLNVNFTTFSRVTYVW